MKGYTHPKFGDQAPLARTVINHRISRIRRMFKWAVENDMVPPTVFHGLLAIRGLQRGRSEAIETDPVRPVSRAVVEDTLPILPPIVADMVRLQLETGMRPGELVVMRALDIDMAGKVWLYRPGSDMGQAGQHKTAHHGHSRVVPIGPKGQAIIREHLKPHLEAYLFSPQNSVAGFRARQRVNRKSKVQPSQSDRRNKRPRKKAGERYTSNGYALAIAAAIKRHNSKVPEEQRIPHWSPNKLRHTRATELRRQFGLDVARAVLGHRTPVVTEVYAEIDQAKAMQAMEEVG